jgi:hypothetical protein
MRERGIRSQRKMPTDKTEYGDWQVFRVWANQPTYQEDPTPLEVPHDGALSQLCSGVHCRLPRQGR